MPINNSAASNTAKVGAKPQPTAVRCMKEELELLIQQLRNLQKQRASLFNKPSLEQLVKTAHEFVDKSGKQLAQLGEQDVSVDSQLQLRQLLAQVRQLAARENENQEALDATLGLLSKTFNELMQALDKLGLSFSQSLNLPFQK